MDIVVLGRGKTGSLVAECAQQRGHRVKVLASADNPGAAGLTGEFLRDVGMVIDFTMPTAVTENIAACARAGKSIVVGTTGWSQELPKVSHLVEQSRTGLLHAANFSLGVNLFLEVARTAAEALKHHYSGQIFERHHSRKRDAPSGTALALQKAVEQTSGRQLQITAFREGDVIGMHEVTFESSVDKIYLCHDAKSRLGFAEGAVRAAEWLVGRSGVFDFRDVWRDI